MKLSAHEVRAAYFAVSTCRRSLAGRTVPQSVVALASRLESVVRHGEPVTQSRQPENTTTGESKQHDDMEFVGTRLAARMLGVSVSTVLRRAADLDGRMVGHQWVFPAAVVAEYRDGLKENT